MNMHRIVAFLVSLLLSISLGVLGKSDKLDIERTAFKSAPVNLFYFEDSDVVLLTDSEARTSYRSEDAGVKWQRLDGVDEGMVLEVLKHPYDNQVAVVIGLGRVHWITKDQGKTWKKWECEDPPTLARPAISFHASDPDRMLFITADCLTPLCKQSVYYTTDGFRTQPKLLQGDAMMCLWAKSTDLFTTGNEDLDRDQVLCIVKGAFSPFSSNFRLLASDDFFQTKKESLIHEGKGVAGVLNLAAVKSYIVAAAKSERSTELAMYVTDDGSKWHRAEFGEHRLEEDAYTLLESTNYSMQVDVLTTKPTSPMGVLLTSNSNGTFFTKNVEHTNRNMRGLVDFEKIQNIQGIVLVNTVENWEKVEQDWSVDKNIKTQISFDDGRTWQPLRVGDNDMLHLHSVTDQRNMGRIFSSTAPGIVMGVGNKGEFLRGYDEGDTYVSDDAGLTWRKSLDGPHMYEFGDQGAILVAIEDGQTNKIKWSLDHGKEWDKFELDEDDKIQPLALTTVPHSTSLKFIVTALRGRGQDSEYYVYSLNFKDLHEDTCGKKDFEEWYARVDEKGEPSCIMGHTQKFRRRKAVKRCFVNDEFRDPVPVAEDCKCKGEDYECDYENGFTTKDGECILTGPMSAPEGTCKEGDKKFKGSSGYRLIPGNTCVKKDGVTKDEPVERDCEDLKKPVASGKISTEITKFDGDSFAEYYYLERGENSSGNDETIIMRTDERKAYVTHDHGKTWMQVVDDEDDEVVAIYPHQYINDMVYLITPSRKVYYSIDRGTVFDKFEAPVDPNQDQIQILSFHPKEKNWLIWTGARDCTSVGCKTIAHVSTHRGDKWEPMLRSVRKCQFVYREGRDGSDKLVYCEQYDNEDTDGPLSLFSSDDWFEHKKELKRNVINFATMAEYIVVAVRNTEQQSLQVDASIDGQVFADAQFPSNFEVAHQQAYTVLDSSTHAVFLHVTVNNVEGQEYGSILKSNSNGTSYVLSVDGVNRNLPGYVDFEKMQGLEGVAVINRVANIKEVDGGSAKKLKTYITHNDGAEWAPIPRPDDPPPGKRFDCNGRGEKCTLHLHGYTERRDPRDTFSSPSAVGLMIATGNVGEYLTPKREADTFITRDGGVTWYSIAPGNWQWEYGDQGSIIVIVKEDEPTNEILYSLDEGKKWISYQFTDQEMTVEDITTVPSDTSRNFMLWGRLKGYGLVTVNLDFSGLEERNRQCVLSEANPDGEDSDYELWEPKHPESTKDNCLFGHVAQYHRKKHDSDCYNGREFDHDHNILQPHAILKNCSCERRDFECDYNYERQSDGSCKLVEGLNPPNPQEVCKNEDAYQYFEITGYRRIPLTTCQHGKELDYTSATHTCPGKEREYAEHHGISGIGLFFAVVLPIATAAGIGFWVWKNWDGKFGRIRLNDGGGPLGTATGYGAFDRDAPWIKVPVMAVSGIVAVLAAVPLVVGSLWNLVSTRFGRSRAGSSRPFTSRSSFQRGRGDYAAVGDDEGELLGEDSDEDV